MTVPDLDRDKYDFHPVANIPRLFVQAQRGTPPLFTELTGVFDPLLSRLLRRHPDWQAVILPYYGTSGVPRYTSLLVSRVFVVNKEWDQVLGTLDYSRGMYQLSNHRIRDDLIRKSMLETKDLNKALKVIDKYFYPKKNTELFTELKSTAEQAAYFVKRKASTEYEDSISAISDNTFISCAIIPNLPTLLATPKLDDKARQRLTLLPERKQALSEARRQELTVEAGPKLMVHVVMGEDTYGVAAFKRWTEPEDFTPVLPSALSSDVRTKLAMLKLTGDKTVIPDVGVRLSTSHYLIFHDFEGDNA